MDQEGLVLGSRSAKSVLGVLLGGQPSHSQPRHCANVVLSVISTRDALHVGSGAAEAFFFLQKQNMSQVFQGVSQTRHHRMERLLLVGAVTVTALLLQRCWRRRLGGVPWTCKKFASSFECQS